MTGLRRKLRDLAAAFGAGLLGGFLAMLFGCGVFCLFFYEASSEDYRDVVLIAVGQVMGILGFLLCGSLAAIPRAGVVHALGATLVAMGIVALLCASGNAGAAETVIFMVVGISGLVPAAVAGVLVQRAADRSAGPSRAGGLR